MLSFAEEKKRKEDMSVTNTVLTVLSIGPGDPALLNQVTMERIYAASPLILRTDHHPLAAFLRDKEVAFLSLDDLYEQSEDFDLLNQRIAERVWVLASGREDAVYAVPDLLTDRSVDALYRLQPDRHAEIVAIPGFSYADRFFL